MRYIVGQVLAIFLSIGAVWALWLIFKYAVGQR